MNLFNKIIVLFFFLNFILIKPTSISYLILSHNETTSLDYLLKFLYKNKYKEDEIIVIDDFSDNKETINILQNASAYLGTKVYKRHLNFDFASQRNYGNSLCSKDFIFCIDADQVPSLYLIQNIKKILTTNADSYRVPATIIIKNLPDTDTRLNSRGWIWPTYKIVIYKNKNNIKWHKPVHESIDESNLKTIEKLPSQEKFALIEIKTYQKTSNSFYFYLNCYKQWMIRSLEKKDFTDFKIALKEFRSIANNIKEFLSLFEDTKISNILEKENLYHLLKEIDQNINNKESLKNFIKQQYILETNKKLNLKKLLEKYEKNINAITDKDGNTLLMHAAYNNKKRLTKLLISKGANASIRNIHGNTALDHANFKGNKEIVEILCKPTIISELKNINLTLPNNINEPIDNEGHTILMYAIKNNKYYLTKILLNYNANPLIKDKYGKIAIDYAENNSELQDLLLTKTLAALLKIENLNFNGVVNLPINDKNQTFLIYATINNKFLLAKLLIKYGADITIKDDYNKNALDYASYFFKNLKKREYRRIFKYLVLSNNLQKNIKSM